MKAALSKSQVVSRTWILIDGFGEPKRGACGIVVLGRFDAPVPPNKLHRPWREALRSPPSPTLPFIALGDENDGGESKECQVAGGSRLRS